MATSYKVDIYGLDELKDIFDEKKIDKKLYAGVANLTNKLHKELESKIIDEYTFKSPLSSVRIGKSKSIVQQGKNVVIGGLEYRTVYRDLSKFPYEYFLGNINADAKRPGQVHRVKVRRNNGYKIVHGKSHRGGFVPKTASGRAVTFGRFGSQMFERTSRHKYPLRLLLGPSLTMAAERVFENDPNIKVFLTQAELDLINLL